MPQPRDSAKQRFLDQLESSFANGTFVKLTLAKPATPAGDLKKLLLRPILVRGEKRCSIVSRFKTRDLTANHPFHAALAIVAEKLGAEFLNANLFTESGQTQLELDGTKDRLSFTPGQREPATLQHDRTPARWVDPHAPYLHALGVTDAHGKVRERMGDKFRQIERFVDLLSSAYRESHLAHRAAAGDSTPVTLSDMGSGKGYLTFAAYDYFQRIEKIPATVTGVEARKDLVTLCNQVALSSGFTSLHFVESTIESTIAKTPLPPSDILVALHACDTATDDALFAGIRAGSQIILVSPCCQKELRPQMDLASRDGPLHDIMRHGVFAGRHAEIATDALRALLLERSGYAVRVSEFISAEHTARNVMIIATRRSGGGDPTPAGVATFDQRIAALKSLYGIHHHRLEQLLLG